MRWYYWEGFRVRCWFKDSIWITSDPFLAWICPPCMVAVHYHDMAYIKIRDATNFFPFRRSSVFPFQMLNFSTDKSRLHLAPSPDFAAVPISTLKKWTYDAYMTACKSWFHGSVYIYPSSAHTTLSWNGYISVTWFLHMWFTPFKKRFVWQEK